MKIKIQIDDRINIEEDLIEFIEGVRAGDYDKEVEAIIENPPTSLYGIGMDLGHGGRLNVRLVVDKMEIEVDQVHIPTLKAGLASIPLPSEIVAPVAAYFNMFPNKIVGDATFEFESGSVRYCNDVMSGSMDIPFGLDNINEMAASFNAM